jgi:hypothetical protein
MTSQRYPELNIPEYDESRSWLLEAFGIFINQLPAFFIRNILWNTPNSLVAVRTLDVMSTDNEFLRGDL